MNKWLELLTSRKFILALGTIVSMVAAKLGWDVSETMLTNVGIVVGSLIGGMAYVDGRKAATGNPPTPPQQ